MYMICRFSRIHTTISRYSRNNFTEEFISKALGDLKQFLSIKVRWIVVGPDKRRYYKLASKSLQRTGMSNGNSLQILINSDFHLIVNIVGLSE